MEDDFELSTVCHRPESMDKLQEQTKFTKKELQVLYRGFKNVRLEPQYTHMLRIQINQTINGSDFFFIGSEILSHREAFTSTPAVYCVPNIHVYSRNVRVVW